MGISKRLIWSSEQKHRWHLSIGKKKRMDKLYDKVKELRTVAGQDVPRE